MATSNDARDRELLSTVEDPFLRRSLKAALHLRRYMPFYVFGTIWIITLAAFPALRNGDEPSSGQQVASESDTLGGVGTSNDTVGGDTGSAGTDTGTQTAAGPTASGGAGPSASGGAAPRTAAPKSVAASVSVSKLTEGKMRDGRDCAPGVRQIPISTYATQCTAKFAGDNGGATYAGVSGDKIRIVRRSFPDSANSQAAAAIGEQAGLADEETAEATRDTFIAYFQKTYELYGRQVEFIDYESQNGNSTEEAQGRGREGACADATFIKKELKAFATTGGSGPFSECAAAQGMLVFSGGAYFPETWFKKFHPFVWNTVTECERISYQVGEYVGKRLYNRNAKWAGDQLFRTQKRKFGVYVPDNDEYQSCVNIYKKEANKYGAPNPEQYNYQLDISRFPDQAAQGAVQFKATGVTTVVLACDPISVIVLTQAATKQAWFPEWYIIGVAGQDTDNLARLYDQDAVDGSLFGMSQLGQTTKLLGPTSEPGRVYKLITGKEIPDGTSGSYFSYVHIFNFLQAAGPILTPATVAEGAKSIIPGGAPDFANGYWSFADAPDGRAGVGDHTAIDDSREVYWVCNGGNQSCTQPAPDGNTGTFLETYNGKRFRNGEWPNEEPPVYPA